MFRSLKRLNDQDEDGTVVFALPFPSLDSTFPICDIEHDMGVTVKAIFDLGSKANGKLFPLVSEFIKVHSISPKIANHQVKNVAADFEKGR